ncbi:aldo/keto reductase [Corynebacterium callunae]|uniref:aldo/keto reductase n=1 Tax=Corynebacterium callunae TaxID=1721 RepID=UPI003981C336
MGAMSTYEFSTPARTLIDGSAIPQLGLGTWKLAGEHAYRVVREALEIGYRHIDTATLYDNEEVVGKAINDAIKAGEVSRDDLFITSKVWNDEQGTAGVNKAFNRSLDALGLDYLDLYLIHWPCASQGLYKETFEAMAKIQGLGHVQSIGVANFYPEVLRDLVSGTGITPAVNQVELHPGFSQPELRALHDEMGIITEAWAPLAKGELLTHPKIVAIAQAHEVPASVIILRWLVQLGCVAIPKSAHRDRLISNLDIHGVTLSEAEISTMLSIDEEPGMGRKYGDPLVFGNQS